MTKCGLFLKTLMAQLIASSLLAVAFTSTAKADVNLVFGAYTADKPTAVVKKFQPFLALLATDLTQEMGQPVNISMKIARTYDEGIDDLVQGRVDFSRFGPASYITAKTASPRIGIIAMETEDGEKVFKGVIAINATSDLTDVAQLRGRSFAFGDNLSTIGRFLAQDLLLNAGITAADLSHFDYLGRHDAVGAAVGAGSFDAGALKSSTFNKLVAKNVPIKILIEFDNVTKPWIHRADLDPMTVEAMRKVFLTMPASAARKSVTKTDFAKGEDKDFESIRRAMNRSVDFGG